MKQPKITPIELKRLRRLIKLSQTEMAQLLKVSRVTYNSWERDRLVKGIPDWVFERTEVIREKFKAWQRPPEAGPRKSLDFDGMRKIPTPKSLWPEEDDD